MYECLSTSMDVHMCVAGAFEGQGKVLDSWDWSYTWLGVTLWVLGTKPVPSARAVNAPIC